MKKNTWIEIWGDVVDAKSLLISIITISTTTLGMHLFAPKGDRTLGLFFGLGGAVIGFMIIVFLIKPKRIIKDEEEMK
ncbi:MAG: hypothetical protein ACNA7U_08065 [Candidatus Izemoplasmataceae bacterium]|uniref:hypothetical protein n=1 Tax=Liberiplasma polymorphum TaxID=3374570 RepID=UPI00377467C6